MDLTLGRRLKELSGPVLITGHTGFKGTWLTLLLQRLQVPVIGLSLPAQVHSLYERAGRLGQIPEEFVDIRNYEAVRGFIAEYTPSAIFHLAAQPLVLDSYENPRLTFETNVMGTVNVLDSAFATESVQAVAAVTTDKVYRNDNSGKKFVESDALAGKDPYSASKVGTESAVAAWKQITKVAGGPKVVALRAGNVIGGGDWAENRLLPDLIRGFSSNTPVKVRNSLSTRPWQHVLDPLVGYLRAIEVVLAGSEIDSLNFGPSGDSISVREVVEISRARWPHSVSVNFEEQTDQALEAESLQLDSQLARTLLGWKCAWDQRESVLATINWWDKVLNDSVSPLDACALDVELALAKTQSLGIS